MRRALYPDRHSIPNFPSKYKRTYIEGLWVGGERAKRETKNNLTSREKCMILNNMS